MDSFDIRCQKSPFVSLSQKSAMRNFMLKSLAGLMTFSIRIIMVREFMLLFQIISIKQLDIAQEEYCFDLAYLDGGPTLLINSKEQMFTEN